MGFEMGKKSANKRRVLPPKNVPSGMRKMIAIASKTPLKGLDEKGKDLEFWLSRTPQERLSAVTTLIRESLAPGQRMDRVVTGKRKMHP